ncbi:hypothetical protein [Paenibacillus mesophilus]|nr:hypothetical protein [Paenibacillus mesophilus]
MLPSYGIPIIVAVVVLGLIGFIYSIRVEMRYRERMRKEMEEIRRTKRT